MARWACTYSARAWATVSSVDHSQLNPSSSASMHGFGTAARTASPSSTCTVFSSIVRAPASQAVTMFCASWVCGPAAGPTGVARVWPQASRTVRPDGRKKCSERRPKTLPCRRCSARAHSSRVGKANGRIRSPIGSPDVTGGPVPHTSMVTLSRASGGGTG